MSQVTSQGERRTAQRLAFLGLAAALAAGCGGKPSTDAPWLTMPDRQQHAAMFTLIGTSHATTDCNGCHTNPATFKVFDCASCHTKATCDTAHAGVVVNYKFAMPACVECHKDGTTGTVDHVRFFDIAATGPHHLACADCHTDAARRTDPATLACATCHATRPGFATAHAQVKDFAADPVACLACHAEAGLLKVAAHQARFPIALGSVTHDTACLQCHASPRADKPFATDFTSFDCTACHGQTATNAAHAGMTGYAYASATCYGCHATGAAAGAPANHPQLFAIDAASAHGAVGCSQCHGDPAHRTDPATLLCATCHATRPGFATAHAKVKDFTNTSPACLQCHAQPNLLTVAAHQAKFPVVLGSTTHDTACLHCHTTARTDRPYPATNFAAFDCTACHTSAATTPLHAGVTGYAFGSASCFQCHPSGAGGAPANHPAIFPIGAGSAHASITCAQCHADPANRATTTTLLCATCHLQRTPTLAARHTGATSVPVPDYKADNASCLRCHADGQVDRGASHPTGRGTPAQESRHRTAGCTKCHVTNRTDKPFAAVDFDKATGCSACH